MRSPKEPRPTAAPRPDRRKRRGLRPKPLVCALLALVLVSTARATTYYFWNNSFSKAEGNFANDNLPTYGNWSELSNWRTKSGATTKRSAGWDTAASLPGETSELGRRGNFAFDMENGVQKIGAWGYDGKAYSRQGILIRNGELQINGSWFPSAADVWVESGGILTHLTGDMKFNTNDGNGANNTIIWIKSGGTLNLTSATATVQPRNLLFQIDDNGTMTFNPHKFEMPDMTMGSSYTTGIKNAGTLHMPNGLVFANGGSGTPTFVFQQNAGTLNLGGVINGMSQGNRALALDATFAGGTINATGAAAVSNINSLELSGTTTWNVDAGVTMDLTSATKATVASDTAVTKTGAGSLTIPDAPDTLTVSGGTATIAGSGGGTVASLTVAGGAKVVIGAKNTTITSFAENAGTVTIAAPGLVISSVDSSATLTGGWAVNTAQFSADDVVVTTDNAAIRSAVVAALTEAGVVGTESGNTVTISGVAAKTFNGGENNSTDLSVAGNWECKYVPSGYDVTIAAAAEFAAGSPVFSSITVTPDGSLSVADGSALPAVTLQGAATITIAEGAAVTLPASTTGEVVDGKAPTVVVSAGAVLTLDADAAYANITFINNGGTITRTTSAPLTFNWVGGSDYGAYTTLGNWQTRPVSGGTFETASRLPCASDQFYKNGDFYLDLEGGSGEIGSWPTPGDEPHYLSVSNGVFTIKGEVVTWSGVWNITDGGTVRFAEGTTFTPADGRGAPLNINIGADSLFDFNGTMINYSGAFTVNDGGRANFNYSKWSAKAGSNQTYPKVEVNSGGYAAFPHGLVWSSGGYSSTYTFNLKSHAGAELLLGGDVSKSADGKMTLNVAIDGGKVDVVSNVTITANSSTLSGEVEFDVAEDIGFHLSNFTVDENTAITKSGAGVLYLDSATAPASLAVNAGSIGFYTANAAIAFPETTTFAPGARILLGVNGLTIESAPDNATFAVDAEAVTKDAAIVSTADETLRSRIVADLTAQLAGQTYEVRTEGEAILISGVSPYTFTNAEGDQDFTNPKNWAGGTVPSGVAVVIRGNMQVTSANASAFASYGFTAFSIERGAAVSVADGVTLPSVTLSLASSLTIADGATVTMGAFTGAATADTIPVLTVGEGATLTVAGGETFGNVNLQLKSGATLATSGSGGLTFGYAGENETAYFAMYATNATINASSSRVSFGSPAAGGMVVMAAENAVQLLDVTLSGMNGCTFGTNNPTDHPFEVMADNTSFTLGGSVTVGGAATLTLAHGAKVSGSNAKALSVADAGQLRIEEGGLVKYTPDSGSPRLVLGGGANESRPAVVLAGGTFWPWKLDTASGAKRTIDVAADSNWDMHYHEFWSSDHRNIPFDAAAITSLSIEEGATLTLRNIDGGAWNSSGNLNRYYRLGTAPIAGAGSLALTNAFTGCTSALLMQGGSNTCTGALTVDEDSTLYFADGANWAGTVVANGHIALTNGANAASATFGTLRLADGVFPIRLWHDAEDGYTCDQLNFTGAGLDFAGGTLAFAPQGDCELEQGAWVALGRWSADAVKNAGPAIRVGERTIQLRAAATAGEDGLYAVSGRIFTGFTVIVR